MNDSGLYRCKSGKHWWTRPEDAAKCCNGYRRDLLRYDGERAHFVWTKVEPGQERPAWAR